MSTDSQNVQSCDGCYRDFTKKLKLTRREGPKDYCPACYKRLFHHVPCATCSAEAIVLKTAISPPCCRACDLLFRRCVRCQQPVPQAALKVAGGVVCPGCVSKYQELKPCSRCTQLVPQLSRAPSLGVNDLICNNCRMRLTHRTCSRCRRYRPVADETNGKPLCEDCLPGQEMNHRCPVCTKEMKGSGTGLCMECTCISLMHRDLEVQRTRAEKPWVQTLIEEFADWLVKRECSKLGVNRLFLKGIPFFIRLDTTFSHPKEITGETLATKFGTAYLRKHLIASRFLQQNASLGLSDTVKQTFAEKQYITDKLQANSKKRWGKLLAQYVSWLESKQVATRTSRLYLRAAELFAQYAELDGTKPWRPEVLSAFLIRKKSSRASLSRFIGFSREVFGWPVSMIPKTPGREPRHTRTVLEIETLQKQIVAAGGPHLAPLEDMERLCAKVFGFELAVFQREIWRLEINEGALCLAKDCQQLRIPNDLIDTVRAWHQRRFASTIFGL